MNLKQPDVPASQGREPLLNVRHERFCWEFAKGTNGQESYLKVFESDNRNVASTRSCKLLKRRDIVARVRWILDQEGRDRLSKMQISKDAIELGLWEVANRCLQKKRVETPKELRDKDAQLCLDCFERTPDDWCQACKYNQKLVRDWQNFGGVYTFNPKGVIAALVPLGKERGMFADRKLVGNMEGDELIDSMTDSEVRNLVRSLAGEVGLRVVEAGSEGAPGAQAQPGADVQPVSKAGAVPQTRH